jgi:hypothetical protein
LESFSFAQVDDSFNNSFDDNNSYIEQTTASIASMAALEIQLEQLKRQLFKTSCQSSNNSLGKTACTALILSLKTY